MDLIIGGAYQGKREYVKREYGIREEEIFSFPPPEPVPERASEKAENPQREKNPGEPAPPGKPVPEGETENAGPGREEALWTQAASGKAVCGLHHMVLSALRRGDDPAALLESRLPDFQETVFICEDLFCGVVPADPEMRALREAAGRCVVLLAGRADRVIRVFCGIGTRIR